jgi:nitrite reductase (NADH) large subunit
MKHYLIIGNGAAGNAAAESIRRLDPEGKIGIFTREKHFFYYRPALPDYLTGEKQLKDFTIHPAAWYERNGIDLYRETEIAEIDFMQKRVVARNGKRFPYDKILLACGAKSFRPPIKGSETKGVFTLRTIEDADAIREKALACRRAVVIGGGVLGLEAGNSLRKLGLGVSVVESSPRLLPRQTDGLAAAILQRMMERMGFCFYLGAKTKEITPEGAGMRVCLEGGDSLAAELVLISAGVRPDLQLNDSLKLQIGKGLAVNDSMETKVEGVYAAGDLVEHRDQCYGIWPASMEQGRVAGTNMTGKESAYTGTLPANVLKVAGIGLFAAGDMDPEGKREAIVQKDEAQNRYRKFVFQDRFLVGTILLGDTRGQEEIQRAIKIKKDMSFFKKNLADGRFDFSCLE